ncbi:hypothetical protein BCIN_02g01560 [Botrytis cinerea B05.10]|uniref:Benzoylformate decarboxylase protein n=4 Tax=Botryotinia fuckeliana TaxID=40559 RepID=A0A384J7X3_BOTFB|nr:hypothetical protein BCIN_02g01560 [Botrytis cinerea B05.10]ATZ46798.1 hypothetical protein BCIN_02g01560 [Botrytis cinerea B05.10]EMR82317.1 putative benzoylformate decarboxylase protein [Botrytis cinerea BcDW1]CCD48487.1 hypothetical protein BofuT4P277000023001 [Botrytis cinerea T4]
MPLSTIHSAPALDSFTPLVEHQTQTPSTFYDARPILHYHAKAARAVAYGDYIKELPFFADGPAQSSEAAVVETVDAYISTENVTIFNNTTSAGLAIPYTSISLHATQRLPDPTDASKGEVTGLFMQLETPPPAGDDTPSIIELVLIPAEADSTQTLYEALTNCSNLVPDEEDEDMEGGPELQFEGNVGYEGISGLPGVQQGVTDGGLPPPFPGSGGWITAENVSEYFDADGNWIGGGESVEVLGEGAGRVRGHDEVDGEAETNGHDEGDEASKRPRTD